MSDLRSLFENAPTTAGFFTGQQIASDRQAGELKNQETLADIAAKQQAFGFNEQNNPLKLEHQGIMNKQGLAQLPGMQADSDRKGVDARVAKATEGTTIDSTNSKNRYDVFKQKIDEGKQMTQLFGNIGNELSRIPPPMRSAYLAQQFQQYGLDANDPKHQQMIEGLSRNPEAAAAIGRHAAEYTAQNTAEYIREQMKEQAANKRNAETNSTHRYVADKSAEARVAAASKRAGAASGDILQRVKEGRTPPANAAVQFELLASLEDDDSPKKAEYNKLAQTMNALALQLKNSPPSADLGALGVQQAQPPRPVAGQGGSSQAPQLPSGWTLKQ